jgi:hypothetical protein
MLLHCEREAGASDEAALAVGWLRAGTLDSLIELNELCLALLVEQSAVRAGPPGGLLQQLAELSSAIDAAARRRAAACPYLLLDAGFADPLRWRSPGALPQVGDASIERYACYFTVPAAAEVARLVFIYAWHLARTQAPAARLLLGMAAPSTAYIARYTLRQMQILAESHLEWLRPRWPARVQVWRELLLAAACGDTPALERAKLRGVMLLAAEVRLGTAGPNAQLALQLRTDSGRAR